MTRAKGKRSRSANFGAGRRASSKAALEWKQRQIDGRETRRHGSLADQRDRHLGRKPQRRRQGPPRPKNLEQQSREWKQQQQPKKRKAPRKPAKPNPGGYRSDDPRYQARSPKYAEGAEHGREDCLIVAQCPPGSPVGMRPESEWSAMYRAGYRDEWANASPHECTKECKNNQQ